MTKSNPFSVRNLVMFALIILASAGLGYGTPTLIDYMLGAKQVIPMVGLVIVTGCLLGYTCELYRRSLTKMWIVLGFNVGCFLCMFLRLRAIEDNMAMPILLFYLVSAAVVAIATASEHGYLKVDTQPRPRVSIDE